MTLDSFSTMSGPYLLESPNRCIHVVIALTDDIVLILVRSRVPIRSTIRASEALTASVIDSNISASDALIVALMLLSSIGGNVSESTPYRLQRDNNVNTAVWR